MDEYEVFKSVVQMTEAQNPQWYQRLAGNLSQDDVKAIKDVFKLCEQRIASRKSKKIEQAGGKEILMFHLKLGRVLRLRRNMHW